MTAVETDFITYTSLSFVDEDRDTTNEIYEESDSDEDEQEGASGGQQKEYQPSPQKQQYPDVSFEDMKRAVDYRNETKKPREIGSVMNRFRWIQNARHYYYIAKIVKAGGARNMKLIAINDFVLEKFNDAVANRCRIHDGDLIRWALSKKRDINYSQFKASASWLLRFKRRNRIGVRSITHIVSKKSVENMDIIKASGVSFVESMRNLMNPSNLSSFFNVDQSGFRKEMHGGGTLAFKGVKKVEAKVQSVGSTTHSYTIMPVISANGVLLSPLFIVLQEAGNQFGPRVSVTMKRPENLYITCSKSGIVTKALMNEWFLEVFLKDEPREKHLLCDALSTYKDTSVIDSAKSPDQRYHLHIIPQGTTGFVQPLDVFFFRQWKSFVKKISDHVIMEDYDTQLFQRDNILFLQSLVHDQFSCWRYQPFIRQAWIRSGYYDVVENFENPVEYCFSNLSNCNEHLCNGLSLLRCSWCQRELCFTHFFTEMHVHTFYFNADL